MSTLLPTKERKCAVCGDVVMSGGFPPERRKLMRGEKPDQRPQVMGLCGHVWRVEDEEER